jgi:limonene-1,2-epoxide hydrolase
MSERIGREEGGRTPEGIGRDDENTGMHERTSLARGTQPAPCFCLAIRATLGFMSAPLQSPAPAHDDMALSPIQTVEAFLRALEVMDFDRAAFFLADDAVYQNVPLPAHRGKEAVLRTLKRFFRITPRFEVQMRNIAERNGIVLTERIDILSGPLVYLDIWVCGTFEVRHRKITLWRDYFDLSLVGAKLLSGPLRRLFGRVR